MIPLFVLLPEFQKKPHGLVLNFQMSFNIEGPHKISLETDPVIASTCILAHLIGALAKDELHGPADVMKGMP